MRCTSCGKEIPDGSAFCPYCGAKQAQEEQSEGVPPHSLRIIRALQPQQEKTAVVVLVDKQTKMPLASGESTDTPLQDGQHILDFTAGFFNCSVCITMPEQNEIRVQYDATGKKLIVTGGDPVAANTFVRPICEFFPNDPVDAPADKAELLQRLRALYNHFSCKKAQYAEYAELCEQKENFKWPGWFWWIVAGAGIGFIAMMCFCMALYLLSLPFGGFSVIPTNISNNLAMFCWLIVTVLFAFGEHSAAKKQADAKCQKLLFRIPELETELIDWYNQAPDCFLIYDYCEPRTIAYLVELVSSGRADTFKEALNRMLAHITPSKALVKQRRAADRAAEEAALTWQYMFNSSTGKEDS